MVRGARTAGKDSQRRRAGGRRAARANMRADMHPLQLAPVLLAVAACVAPRPDASAPDAGLDGGSACEEPLMGTGTIDDGTHRMDATASALSGCLRRYSLRTTQPLRDGVPGNPRVVDERADAPRLRSGNVALDALYALALEEVRENAVEAISDGAFDEGRALPCPAGGCFETGRLWRYVWTRDVSFAAHLALAALDPIRTRNSLAFKTSPRRDGSGREVVQDTGTGGSWPVSTDRVAWALGARELLKHLGGADRAAFVTLAHDALRHTLERDRETIFDAHDGLYTGETSFLDWREQTYPAWMASDPAAIAATKALSTNVLHAVALDVFAATCDEMGEGASAALWRDRATALRAAIRAHFRLPGRDLLASFRHGPLAPAPAERHDLLGHALAILEDVLTPAEAAAALARYPHFAAGPPAVWPQQQRVPIYHNRSVWPFTVAYWAKAGRRGGNAAVVTHATRSLVRAAALNLSNMENLELVSGAPFLDDGEASGPVVNSQRQLWSVAGFVSLVHDVLLGIDHAPGGLEVRPYVTKELRHTLFANTDRLVLEGLRAGGRTLRVVVLLPPKGASRAGAYVAGTQRAEGDEVEITLEEGADPGQAITRVTDTSDWKRIFAPREPVLERVEAAGDRIVLALSSGGEAPADVSFDVFRDGVRIAQGLDGATTSWTDPDARAGDGRTWCWSLVTRFRSSGTASHHSPAACFWGPSSERVQEASARDFAQSGGVGILSNGRFHTMDWGDPGHTIAVEFVARVTAPHLVQLVGANGAGPVNTGVACGAKWVEVHDGDRLVAAGLAVLPQTGAWDDWRDSTLLRVPLLTGRTYRVTIGHDARSANMSAFAHFERYTGALGGRSGAFHRVDVSGVKLLALPGRGG